MSSIAVVNIKDQPADRAADEEVVVSSENPAAGGAVAEEEQEEEEADATVAGAAGAAGSTSTTPKKATVVRVAKKKKWKKPKDKPKRPLSAYNIFFRHEREQLIYGADGRKREKNKIGFAALAKNIAFKWKRLEGPTRRIYDVQAEFEQLRYKAEVEEWKSKQQPGDSGSTPFKKSEIDWAKRRDEFAEAMALASSSYKKPSAEEVFNQHHGRNALINQMMLSQLMGRNFANGNSNSNNNGGSNDSGINNQFTPMGQQYPQYASPMMVNAEIQSQLSYLTSGESGLDSLRAYEGSSQLQPRRMSTPTSSEQQQYAQMQQQHNQQQRQQEVEQMPARMAAVGLPGGRRLSIPMGIIDNTHNSNSSSMMSDNCKPSMGLYSGHLPPQQQQQHQLYNIQQQQQAAITTMHDLLIQAHAAAMDVDNSSSMTNNNAAPAATDDSMYPSYVAHGGEATNGRRMSMTSGVGGGMNGGGDHVNINAAPASGRRMPMPLSVEQQMLGRGAFENSQQHQQQEGQQTQQHHLDLHPQQQCRSMSMPMGAQYTMNQHREVPSGEDGSEQQQPLRPYVHDTPELDELADILKDDGDLFDW
jgi:hypothetical protein